jgi:hypothetical protein
MKNRDIIGAFFWMVFGLIFSVAALNYALFDSNIPGPGFLPFAVGICLITLSVAVLIASLSKNGQGDYRVESHKFLPQKTSLRRLLSALICLLLYAASLKHFGYLSTTFFFMVFVLKSIEPVTWKTTFLFAVLTTGLSYALFTILQVELPRAAFGI